VDPVRTLLGRTRGTVMGKSKEMGKPVAELTADELRRELIRCRTLAALYANKVAGRDLRKRLQRRLDDQKPD
jgi:hypothetical protein